jgi:hypothetical protein
MKGQIMVEGEKEGHKVLKIINTEAQTASQSSWLPLSNLDTKLKLPAQNLSCPVPHSDLLNVDDAPKEPLLG